MNTMLFLGLMPALPAAASTAALPGATPTRATVRVLFSENEFRSGPAHKTTTVVLAAGDQLIVELGCNPTTGYGWGEKATNSDPSVLTQVKHKRNNPSKPRPGAGGSQVWTFDASKAGSATVSFSYGRPWEGGEQQIWTLKVTAKVQ